MVHSDRSLIWITIAIVAVLLEPLLLLLLIPVGLAAWLLSRLSDRKSRARKVTHPGATARASSDRYRRSRQWARIRLQAIRRAGARCQLCGIRASVDTLHAHHNNYEREGNEKLVDLITLCPRCHSLFHSRRPNHGKNRESHPRTIAGPEFKQPVRLCVVLYPRLKQTRPKEPISSTRYLRFFLQAHDQPAVLVPAWDIWREQSDTLIYQGYRFAKPQETLLEYLGQAAKLCPMVRRALRTSPCPEFVRLAPSEVAQFIDSGARAMKEIGASVIICKYVSRDPTDLSKPTAYNTAIRAGHGQEAILEAVRRSESRCMLCSKKDDILYTHLNNSTDKRVEHPVDLIVLCRDCTYALEWRVGQPTKTHIQPRLL